MKLGSLGILSKSIFDEDHENYINTDFVYLTTAIDVSDTVKEEYPKIKRKIFEAKYRLISKNETFKCTAIFLSQSEVPDEMISPGAGTWKSIVGIDNTWKYYKILLFFNGKVETCFLHSKCLAYFTWFEYPDKVDTNFLRKDFGL